MTFSSVKNRLRNVAALVAMTCALCLTSCSDDDGMDESLSIFQEYAVVIQDNEKACYANFRLGSAAGERLELTNGSTIQCNTLDMIYLESESADEPPYNYVCVVYQNHQKAIFTFKRAKNKTYVNTIEFDLIPDISLPTIDGLSNGSSFKLDLGGAEAAANDISVTLGNNNGDIYPLMVMADGTVNVSGIPAGYYTLTADITTVIPTQENDGSAKGSMRLTKRKTRNAVKVG